MGKVATDLSLDISKVLGWQEPQFFDLHNDKDRAVLDVLKASNKVNYISDNIIEAIEELYHIEYPAEIDAIDNAVFQDFVKGFGEGNLDNYGKWVFFPWNGTLVHFPSEDDLSMLRGSRNRNLITDEERRALKQNKTILILGLSVGSNVVDSLLMQGIGSTYILVDMDHLGPTNLNRIRAGYDQIGVHKVDLVAKKISELDPYLKQVHYRKGLDDDNLEEILTRYNPDVIIDEMDSLRMKIIIRMRAQKLRIPVLMATDDGDDILMDIERYDLTEQLPILHGILPDQIVEDVLNNQQMNRREAGAIIGKYFVDLKNVPPRMIESLLEVGKTLPSWPQLGGAAVLSGLYIAYATRRILLSQNINSGRFVMGPEEQLNPDIKSSKYAKKKKELINLMTSKP